jgi:hypothetical protein
MENFKYLLIISDSTVLSTSIIKLFKYNSSNWKILLLDNTENKEVDKFILFTENDFNDFTRLYSEIESFSNIYHAIMHVTGSWTRGTIRNNDIFTQSDNMFRKNYYPCLLGNNRFI